MQLFNLIIRVSAQVRHDVYILWSGLECAVTNGCLFILCAHYYYFGISARIKKNNAREEQHNDSIGTIIGRE